MKNYLKTAKNLIKKLIVELNKEQVDQKHMIEIAVNLRNHSC
jgi:hypothetical protein